MKASNSHILQGLVTLFKCPYCPSSTGRVAIDLDAALDEMGSIGLEHGKTRVLGGPIPPLVVFDPDHGEAGPCSHLIEMTVTGFVTSEANRDEPAMRIRDFCVDWISERFACEDPDEIAHEFLWDVIAGEGYEVFRPVTPHLLSWVDREFHVPRSRRIDLRNCCFVAAMHPHQFHRELLENACRFQSL